MDLWGDEEKESKQTEQKEIVVLQQELTDEFDNDAHVTAMRSLILDLIYNTTITKEFNEIIINNLQINSNIGLKTRIMDTISKSNLSENLLNYVLEEVSNNKEVKNELIEIISNYGLIASNVDLKNELLDLIKNNQPNHELFNLISQSLHSYPKLKLMIVFNFAKKIIDKVEFKSKVIDVFHQKLNKNIELKYKLFEVLVKEINEDSSAKYNLVNIFLRIIADNSEIKNELLKIFVQKVSNSEQIKSELFQTFITKIVPNNQTQLKFFEIFIEKFIYNQELKHKFLETFISESGLLQKSANNYLRNPIKSMELMAKLFSKSANQSNPYEEASKKFSYFLNNDFHKFLNSVDLENTVSYMTRLSDIAEEIAEDVKFKELLGKRVVGLGGSFSAGKSSFVNSILNINEDILPVDTRPTTSIPTYLVKNNENGIFTFNRDGDKSEIDRQALLAISHEFNDIYGFGLIALIKNIVIDSVKMPYEHIAFLDTPGYSKADGRDKTDFEVARQHLKNLNALIWLIDIDNGTIRNSDLEFLRNLNLSKDVEMLFVINKADKKPQSEIDKIVAQTEKTLKDSGLKNSYQITAYSSHEQKEFNKNREAKIEPFLQKQNIPQSKLFYFRVNEILQELKANLIKKDEINKNLLAVFNQIDTLNSVKNIGINGFDVFEQIAKNGSKQTSNQLEKLSSIEKEFAEILEVLKSAEDIERIKKAEAEKQRLEAERQKQKERQELIAKFGNQERVIKFEDNQLVWIDTETNLMWEVKTKNNRNDRFILNDAVKYVYNLNEKQYSSYSNWRLPTIDELKILINSTPTLQNVDGHKPYVKQPFSFIIKMASCWYWSSSKYNEESNWVVSFGDISTNWYGTVNSTNTNFVICVRNI